MNLWSSTTKASKKTALITGSNKGLGFEIALRLSRNNYKVIMADKDDQTASKSTIRCRTGNDDIYEYFLDLRSFDSVRQFAQQMAEKVSCIDVLVNNAGIFCMKKKETVDCLDGVMQVNHLSPFLLTNLLINNLKKAKNPRIIFVTSNGSFFNTLTVKTLTTPDYFAPHFISGAIHYYNTKLCNMISSKGFAEKLKNDNIASNCVHPDMMNTAFLTASHKGGDVCANVEAQVAKCLVQSTTKDPEQCADGVVFLAVSPQLTNVTGKYFYNYQVHRVPRVLEDETFCEEIWKESERLVSLKR